MSLITNLTNDMIPESYKQMENWRKIMDIIWKIMTKNNASLEQHYPLIKPIYLDYEALNGYAIFLGRMANKMLLNSQRTVAMLEDK